MDFKGGDAGFYVKFDDTANIDKIRAAADSAGIHDARIQSYGPAADHQVIISLTQKDTSEAKLDSGREAIVQALQTHYSAAGPANTGKLDLDNVGRGALTDLLQQKDPLHISGTADADKRYAQAATAILDFATSNAVG